MPLLCDFPQDGRVWIVFRIDDPRPSGPSSFHPSIAATLRPVPRHLDAGSLREMSDLICDPGGVEDVTVRVPLALAPNLRLGDLWRDGDFHGRGPWIERTVSGDDGVAPSARAARARGRYDTPRAIGVLECWRRIQAVGDANPALWQPISVSRIDGPGGAVEIPAYEIFRAFFALHPRLADAMLSGPWSKTRSALIDEAALGEAKARGADDLVPLLPGLPRGLAPYLHPLLYDPLWEAAAEGIYAERLSALAVAPSKTYAPMALAWPFDLARRTLTVRGFPHPHGYDVFVALEIAGYDWCGPRDLRLGEQIAARGESMPTGSRIRLIEEGGRGPVLRQASAISLVAPLDVEAPSIALPTPLPGLRGAPTLARAAAGSARPRSGAPDGPLTLRRQCKATYEAQGTPTPAVTGSGAAPQRRCPRFREVMHAIERCRAVGGLRSWSVIDVAGPHQLRDNVPVWSCPDRRISDAGRDIEASWSFMVGPNGQRIRRAALVLAIEAPCGAPLLSITLEPGPSRGQTFCSLMFREPAEGRARIINRLLRYAVDHRGVWSDDDAVAADFGVPRFVKWKHISRESLPEDGLDADALVSSGPLMEHIQKAAGPRRRRLAA